MVFASIASMRAMCLFLRARTVVKFFLRAASTLENTDGEQHFEYFVNFPPAGISLLSMGCKLRGKAVEPDTLFCASNS